MSPRPSCEEHGRQIAALGPRTQYLEQLERCLFVIGELLAKREGFVVDFGAFNGLDFSKTLVLEHQQG